MTLQPLGSHRLAALLFGLALPLLAACDEEPTGPVETPRTVVEAAVQGDPTHAVRRAAEAIFRPDRVWTMNVRVNGGSVTVVATHGPELDRYEGPASIRDDALRRFALRVFRLARTVDAVTRVRLEVRLTSGYESGTLIETAADIEAIRAADGFATVDPWSPEANQVAESIVPLLQTVRDRTDDFRVDYTR